MTRRGPEPIPTRVGLSGERDSRFCGKSVNHDLLGCSTPLEMVALYFLKRLPTERERLSLCALSAVLAAADPRIWPLKLARLSACHGSSFGGIAGGLLGLVGNSLGPQSTREAAEMLWSISKKKESSLGNEADSITAVRKEISRRRYVPGFGVPYRNFDQRLTVLDNEMRRLGRHELPFYRLEGVVRKVVSEQYPELAPNVSLGGAALCLDIGFLPEDTATLVLWLVSQTYFCNAAEEASLRSPGLRDLGETSIDYLGEPPRPSPREVESSREKPRVKR
jgi:hypothetical protein